MTVADMLSAAEMHEQRAEFYQGNGATAEANWHLAKANNLRLQALCSVIWGYNGT